MAVWYWICANLASLAAVQGQLPPLGTFGSSPIHPTGNAGRPWSAMPGASESKPPGGFSILSGSNSAGTGNSPAGLGPGSSPNVDQAALQDAVEGIAGLMQRFEQMQPQLGSIPRSELESIVSEGQQLHGRFMQLQETMRLAASGVGGQVQEESRIIGFHRDLALFIERVESKLGIMGPKPPSLVSLGDSSPALPTERSLPTSSFGSLPPLQPTHGQDAQAAASRGRPSVPPASGTMAPATDQRLQKAMGGIVSGMQRFEALHPKLQSLPQHVFHSIASRGQQLHENFVVLQKRGVELAGDGSRQMSEADAVPYAAQLEAFVESQTAFVADAEAQVQGSLGAGSVGLPPAGAGFAGGGIGIAGSRPGGRPLSATSFGASGGLGMGGSVGLGSNAVPGSASGLGSERLNGDRVTPATDQRLSAVIQKVVAQMQVFEALRPQLSRLPQQTFAQIAQGGQELNDRFVTLQRRGASIAGDGSVSMLERDAHEYAGEMESFYKDQSTFVDQARQAVQSGTGGVVLGAGALGGVGLGSASLSGSSAGGSLSGAGFGGASLSGGGFSGPGLGGSVFGGGPGFGGAGMAGRSGFGSPPVGGFGSAPATSGLGSFATAQLDTSSRLGYQ